MLWRRRILPLNYRGSPKTRPWLRLWTRKHLSRLATGSHQFQTLPAIQQRPTIGKETFNMKFWRNRGKLRRSGDLWTGGLLSPVSTKADPWYRSRPLQRLRACHTQSHTKGDGESKKTNMPNICEQQPKNHSWCKHRKIQTIFQTFYHSALRSQPIEPLTQYP